LRETHSSEKSAGSSIIFHKGKKTPCWHEFLVMFGNIFAMRDQSMELANLQSTFAGEENKNFSQYLSFQFYRENLDHLTTITKDSINNFLKTISEIEDEFVSILQSEDANNRELNNPGVTNRLAYMEENY
jgi:hypothetical protein